jgi:hypothetical protein
MEGGADPDIGLKQLPIKTYFAAAGLFRAVSSCIGLLHGCCGLLQAAADCFGTVSGLLRTVLGLLRTVSGLLWTSSHTDQTNVVWRSEQFLNPMSGLWWRPYSLNIWVPETAKIKTPTRVAKRGQNRAPGLPVQPRCTAKRARHVWRGPGAELGPGNFQIVLSQPASKEPPSHHYNRPLQMPPTTLAIWGLWTILLYHTESGLAGPKCTLVPRSW